MEKWLRDYRNNKKKNEHEYFYWSMMADHKEKLILERKKELHELKKRIKYLEQELQGMGIRDFELPNSNHGWN
jgi:hypothetical protein